MEVFGASGFMAEGFRVWEDFWGFLLDYPPFGPPQIELLGF